MRQLDQVLKDHIKSRFDFNDYLKKTNFQIDFNHIEAVVAATYGYEGYVSNAAILNENDDKITKIMIQRMSSIPMALEIDCLSYCANSILKKLHLNAGNHQADYFGKTNETTEAVMAPPTSEGIE